MINKKLLLFAQIAVYCFSSVLYAESILENSETQILANEGTVDSLSQNQHSNSVGSFFGNFIQSIDGFIDSRQYFDYERDSLQEGTYELRNYLRLNADLNLFDFATARIGVNQELDYISNQIDDFESEDTIFRPWEMYVDIEREKFDLRLGRQVIRWGKGDQVNPIDNFTPEDFREFFNLDRQDRKHPVTAAYLKYFPADTYSLETVWIPYFRENLLAGTGRDWELANRRLIRQNFGDASLEEDSLSDSLSNSVYAARLLRELDWGDFSVSYSSHRDQFPTYVVSQDPTTGEARARADWKRQHSIGSDFETNIGAVGFRGEFVYTLDKAFATSDQTDGDFVVNSDLFQNLLGIDYTFNSGLYMNLQLLQGYLPDRQAGMNLDSYESALFARVSKDYYGEKLKLQLTGSVGLTQSNFYYKAEAIYKALEDLKLSAGWFQFGGEEDSFFGQFDANDQFFFRTRYDFSRGF